MTEAAGRPAGPVRAVGAVTAGALAAVAGLHAVWSRSPWPLADRADFADAVVGVGVERTPTPAMCLGVAGALGTAAALVGARAGVLPAAGPRVLRTAGAAGAAGVLLARGVVGPVLFGRGRVVRTERFVRLDRRYYAPFCLALGAGAAVVAAGGR